MAKKKRMGRELIGALREAVRKAKKRPKPKRGKGCPFDEEQRGWPWAA